MMVIREELEVGSVFLSTKIHKIRWHPSKFTYKEGTYTGIIAVGSYDESVNRISVYEVKLGNFPAEMNRLCTQNIKGGTADMKFVYDESRRMSLLLASTFQGDLIVYEAINLREITTRKMEKQALGAYPDLAYIGSLRLHHGSLTSMDASNNREVVTAGSDGNIQIVDLGESVKQMRKIEGSGTAITCVRYTMTNASVAAASNDIITLYDLRSNSTTKIKSEKGTNFQSISPHPHQGNFICSGANDGTVCVWDVRASALPLSSQKLHSDDVWEMHFLPAQSDAVVSCASDTLTLVNYNPENAVTNDFGAKVRSRRELAQTHAQERMGFNACDAHESGVVVGGGDAGCVVLAKMRGGSENYGLQISDENNNTYS